MNRLLPLPFRVENRSAVQQPALHFRRAASCFLLLALLGTSLMSAQKPRDPFTRWESLFNGKDLSGWVKVGNEKWVVDDGVIHGQGVTDQYGYLRTEKRYSDFHLALKFKCEDDGNSGVYFRCDFEPNSVKLTQGLQVEIDRRLGYHTGGIHGVGRSWVAWPAAENEAVLRPNDWNELIIKIEANRYFVRMNGVVVMDFTDPTPKSLEGYIALQLHSGGLGNMKFKEIAIRDLSPR
jgi:hypothetical protein